MIAPIQLGAACLALLIATGQGPEDDAPSFSLPEGTAATVSVGHPYYGKLKHGVKLPLDGPHHIVQRSTRARRWIYGTAYLIRSVLVAAESVDRTVPGGVPLEIGNLSRRGGGDIKLSMSHNTGRDVDIAYYTLSADGESVVSRYHKFGPDGRSKDAPTRYKLDLPRNWAWIRAMITSDEAETQWVIVAPYIENLLVAHARAAGEPEWLIDRAQRMMMLPSWAKLHDNHIHLRVLCSPEDYRRGCDNAGPVWPWNTRMVSALNEVLDEVRGDLSGPSAARIEALRTLAQRHVTTAVSTIAPLVRDADTAVSEQALETLEALVTEANAPEVLELTRDLPAHAGAVLLKTALPMAGADGLTTARALLDGSHPALSDLKRKERRALERAAKRLVRRHERS